MHSNTIYRGEATQFFDLEADETPAPIPSNDQIQQSLDRMEFLIEELHTVINMQAGTYGRG